MTFSLQQALLKLPKLHFFMPGLAQMTFLSISSSNDEGSLNVLNCFKVTNFRGHPSVMKCLVDSQVFLLDMKSPFALFLDAEYIGSFHEIIL